MDVAVLQELGFSPGEIKVYRALLTTGKTSIGEVTRKSRVSRSKVYDILQKLIDKGLVSEVMEEGTKTFTPLDPRKIYSVIEEQQRRMTELRSSLEKEMDRYLEQFNRKDDVRVAVVRGYEGLNNVFEDVLQTLQEGETFIVFTTIPPPRPAPISYYTRLKRFNEERMKKKIVLRLIANRSEDQKILGELSRGGKPELTLLRKSPEQFYTPAVFNIYGSKTAIIIWSVEPIVIMLDSKDASEGFKQYFELLWKHSERYENR